MKKCIALLVLGIFVHTVSDAQYRMRPVRRGPYQQRNKRPNLPPFKPSASISVGYGFPNLDKDQFVQFYNYYPGTPNQTGPLHGSLDYQFNRNASIGLMASHGKITVPYYSYYDPSNPVLKGSLESWSIMLNMVRYVPLSKSVSSYIRTAVGVNLWTQDYTDQNGNKLIFDTPNPLAYQGSIGAKFKLSGNTGLFIEAGYGKYIVSAGLSLKL